MKIISIRAHQFLDYATVVILALIPSLFMFAGTPYYLSYFLAVVHLLMTMLTKFFTGTSKIIPLKLHRLVETIVGPVLLVSPWILGFSAEATPRDVFIGMGVIIILVGFVSDYSMNTPV
jgi:hypothetical protein